MLSSSSLPSWNSPFSKPLGMPTLRIFLTSLGCHSKGNMPGYGIRQCGSRRARCVMYAPTEREISVASPAPITPQPSQKIVTLLPMRLTMFMMKEENIVARGLPMQRRSAQ